MDRYFAWFSLPGTFVLTMLMSLLALVLAILFPTPVRRLCLAAMLFSSVGDLFMTRFMGIDRLVKNYFAIGAGAFMIAHLFYAAGYVRLIRTSGAVLINPGALAMAAAAAILAVWLCLQARRSGRTAMLPLILCYIALISADCMAVLSYAWSQGVGNPMAIAAAAGAVSFLISDLIIGLELVTGDTRLNHLIWWFYPVGQILLLLGAGCG